MIFYGEHERYPIINERTMMRAANLSAILIIGGYIHSEPQPYEEEAKNFFYNSELVDIVKIIHDTRDEMPLEVLYSLQDKFDRWAHIGNNVIPRICLAAVEDCIDLLLS